MNRLALMLPFRFRGDVRKPQGTEGSSVESMPTRVFAEDFGFGTVLVQEYEPERLGKGFSLVRWDQMPEQGYSQVNPCVVLTSWLTEVQG